MPTGPGRLSQALSLTAVRDGPRQLGSGVLLSRSYGECSNLDAVRTNPGLGLLSRSKSEAQNLVYSPAIDAGTRPGTADPDGA